MINLRDVYFGYTDSDFALQIEQFNIASGEAVAVIGPSGCGKTTLLNLLSGVVIPETGEIEVAGVSVSSLSDTARRALRSQSIGMVFQSFELLEYLPVIDNILLPLRIGAGLNVTIELRQRARELAAHVGIGDKLQRYPGQLSQGERQRVAVCRALLLRPPLVLADEPTGNLDPSNKSLVVNLLLEYAQSSGATLVTVTHDRELLSDFERVLDFQQVNQWQAAQ